MQQFRKYAELIIYFLLLICLLLIFGFSLLNWDPDKIIATAWSGKKILLLSIGGCLAFFAIQNCIQGITNRYILIAVSIIAVFLQFCLVFRYPKQLGWDDTNTLEAALGIVTGHESWIDASYFAMVQNQRSFLLVTVLFVWIGISLGVSYAHIPLLCSCISVIGFDLALLIICHTYGRIRDHEAAGRLLWLILFCPGVYLWSGYYYTTNQSILFISLSFWGIVTLWEKEAKVWQIIILGALGMFGIHYRATQAVFWIAVFIIILLHPPKRPIRLIVGLFIGAICMHFLLGMLYQNIIPSTDKDVRLPFTHWLMMAAQDDGAYNIDDVVFSENIPTYQERYKADLELYFERLKMLGPKGVVKLAIRKTGYNWGYGDHAYHPRTQKYDTLYDYIWGSRRVLSQWCQQGYHLMLYITAALGLLFMILSNIRNTQSCGSNYGVMVCTLFYLGAIFFYVLWETNTYASVGFLPFLMILSQEGIGHIRNRMDQRDKTTVIRINRIAALSALCVAGAAGTYLLLSETPYAENQLPVVTQEKVNNSVKVRTDQPFSASFLASRDFDTITLWLTKEKGKEDSNGLYELLLTREDGRTIYQEQIESREITRTVSHDINLEPIRVREAERFHIYIRTIREDEVDPLEVCAYIGPINPYPVGEMHQGDSLLEGYPYLQVGLQAKSD